MQFQTELELTRIECLGDRSKCRRARLGRIRQHEIRMIRHIEYFRPHLQRETLREVEHPRDVRIEGEQSGTFDDASPGITERVRCRYGKY